MLYIVPCLVWVGAEQGRLSTSLGYIKFQTKTKILDEISGFVGWSYQRSFAVSPHLDRFRELGLLTSKFDKAEFDGSRVMVRNLRHYQ